MMKTKTNKYEENTCIYENNITKNYIKQKGVRFVLRHDNLFGHVNGHMVGC